MKLVEEEVFKPVHIIDYQAVCFREKKITNPASAILTVTLQFYYTESSCKTNLKIQLMFFKINMTFRTI